jgi:hypothetical protein
MMTRSLLCAAAWLIAFAPAPAPAQPQPQESLPDTPPGFTWVAVPGAATTLLRPDGWFVKTEDKNGTISSFITLENIDEAGRYQTGLSFNFIRDISKKAGQSARMYAIAFVQEAQRTKDVIKEPWGNQLDTGLLGVGIRFREPVDGVPLLLHMYLIADDQADSIRLFIFESPEQGWDEAWKIGEVMMKGQIER